MTESEEDVIESDDRERVLDTIPEDTRWLRASFLLPMGTVDGDINVIRSRSSADDKYTNSSIGGNWAVNVPPQFTHTADPKIVGIGMRPPEGENRRRPEKHDVMTGMGRYYSESIDDNNQIIHMRFGMCEFNSLGGFFSRAYNMKFGRMVRTGGSNGFAFTIGNIVGIAFSAPFAAIAAMIRGTVQTIKFLTSALFDINGWPSSGFYYLKPAMPIYWATANQVANHLAVNMGLVPSGEWGFPDEPDTSGELSSIDETPSLTSDDIKAFNSLLPDIFRNENHVGINLRAVANKAERLRQHKLAGVKKVLEDFNDTQDDRDKLKEAYLDNVIGNQPDTDKDWLEKYMGLSIATDVEPDTQYDETGEMEGSKSIFAGVGSWLSDYADHAKAELMQGSAYASFRVTGERSISEAFSNTVGESSIASTFKAKSGAASDARFSTAGGNLGEGFIASAVEWVGQFVKGAMEGAMTSFNLDGLGALLGGAFLDFPNVWKDSTANLPKMEYTIELRATYGNKMSIFTDIYVPLSMLLAAALPLSTGRASYGSPFLCEVYHKGRAQSTLAIVESLNVSRGVGNLGWSVDDLPLGIDVTISITDLSTVLHLPIDSSIGAYDESTTYNNYMAILGSIGAISQNSFWPKFNRRKAKAVADFNSTFSVPTQMAMIADKSPVRALAGMVRTWSGRPEDRG